MRNHKNTKFAILIPSLQDYDYMKIVLKSLVENTKADYEVKVHLNTYTPELEELVSRYDKDYTKSNTNLGISPAINICFDRSDADFIFIAESDLVFLPDWDTYIIEAMNRFGEDNIYPVTKIHPTDINNKTDIVRNYGKTANEFDYNQLLKDVDSLRRPNFQTVDCSPASFPRHLHVPFDEDYFPGWSTDAEMHLNAWHIDKNVRWLKSEMSLVYHFKSVASKNFYNDNERNIMCNKCSELFNKKWSPIYPDLNVTNYKQFIIKNWGGYVTQ